MLYPLFFEPVYKEILWGGRNMEKALGRKLPEGAIAESWEICSHRNGMSIVSNGPLKGQTLAALREQYGSRLEGSRSKGDRFPLLIKFIDANDRLSIQVHPDDEYALKDQGDLGKTEMWYVIDASPDGKLIYGTAPGVTKEDFDFALQHGQLEEKLNTVSVKKGDVIFIPSGTVHAIMEGLLIAEIQQNSDTTYRVYDWNRVDASGKSRELHIRQALDVIHFDFKAKINATAFEQQDGYRFSRIVSCEFFQVDLVDILKVYQDSPDGTSFFAYTCVEGSGHLSYGQETYPISTGTSFLIPAELGNYSICGELKLLKAYL